MKSWISTSFSLIMLSSLLLPVTVNGTELEPYSDAGDPNFSLADLAGKNHRLQDYRGKIVLVNFWASWCLPCVHEIPELNELKKRMAKQPFEILALNVGEHKNRVRQFSTRINFNMPILLDTASETFDNWQIKILPTSLLVDANGQIRYSVQGNPGWDHQQTMAIIDKLIKEISNPESIKPGQINPGQINPGQINPGQINPGQINPGQINPGQINPGQINPGQINPGQINPGPMTH